jgi:hypothetical protein
MNPDVLSNEAVWRSLQNIEAREEQEGSRYNGSHL